MNVRQAVRRAILDANRGIREGRTNGPRRLHEGEVVFRIPQKDMPVLARLFPELVCKDHEIRLKAWHKLRNSPIGEQYLVTKTPRQVRASDKRIIVK